MASDSAADKTSDAPPPISGVENKVENEGELFADLPVKSRSGQQAARTSQVPAPPKSAAAAAAGLMGSVATSPVPCRPPPPAPQKSSSNLGKILLAAVGVAGLVGVGLFLAKGSGSAASSEPGVIAAEVVEKGNGKELSSFSLFVDGSRRCETNPCRVTGLLAGEHLVKVSAEGYKTTTAQTVNLIGGQSTALRIELEPDASKPADDAKTAANTDDAKAEEKPAADGEAVDAEKLFGSSDKAAGAGAAADAPPGSAKAAPGADKAADGKKSAAADGDKGIINISSVPSVPVVVDGKPIGTSPKTVRVSPGSHTIVFIGPEGRQVRGVNVQAGKSVSVAARF